MDEEVADVPAIAGQSRMLTKKALLLTEEKEVNMGEWLGSHPELSTKSLKAYKDSAKKSKLWEDKAEELDVESSALLRTWYESIRTKIGKLTSTKSGSATKESTERTIFIMSNFAVLKEHISRVRGRNAMSLKSHIESSVAAQGYLASSESEMEEYVVDSPATILASQPAVPVAATDQTATFPVPASKDGKGKSTKKTAPRRAPGTDDDEEATAITNQLQRQQVEAGNIQGQITQLLEKDEASAMAHFGSFMGKLGSQIDERLVDGFYREALDLTLRTISKSRNLPPLRPFDMVSNSGPG